MDEKKNYLGMNSLLSGPTLTLWGTSTGQNFIYIKYFKVVSQARPITMPESLFSHLPSPALWGLLFQPWDFRSPRLCPEPIFILWIGLLGQGAVETEGEPRTSGQCLDLLEPQMGLTWLGSLGIWDRSSSLLKPSLLWLSTSRLSISPKCPLSCDSWLLPFSQAELFQKSNQLNTLNSRF